MSFHKAAYETTKEIANRAVARIEAALAMPSPDHVEGYAVKTAFEAALMLHITEMIARLRGEKYDG